MPIGSGGNPMRFVAWRAMGSRTSRRQPSLSADQLGVEKELRERLGGLVQAEREGKGWTQEQLAERSGIHWTTVGKIERGLLLPSIAVFVLLARALGVPLGEMLAKALDEPRVASDDDETLRCVRGLPRAERARLLPVLRALIEWKGAKSSD